MDVKETVPKSLFEKLSDKAHSILETLNDIIHKGVTVQEIAEMVKTHDNVQKTSKTLLGITYDFYKLQIQDLTFILEVRKGVIERILFFKVYTSDQVVMTYRSYEDGLTLEDQISAEHLPQLVKDNKKI
ncbi:MAG: hypothetical protein ACK4M9_02125 [Anaerobacillus sp.]|uniref:hypothetical protein n=1 Tax=Anaerobacillus sp. TaxID=1872506 RepID=UPI0039196243